MEYKSFGKEETGRYSLTDFPGCADLVVSHDVYIHEKLRGKGHGKTQHDERLKAASQAHTGIICTVRADNEIEKHILVQKYWKHIWTFKNKNDEDIEVWAKSLFYQP